MGSIEDVSEDLQKTDYFKRLSHWAGVSKSEQENGEKQAISGQIGWRRIYPPVFDTQKDRKIPKFMIYLALPVVLAGPVLTIFEIQPPESTVWFVFWLLELAFVVPVCLVLAGNDYISTACGLVDDDARQWRLFMREKTLIAKTQPISPQHHASILQGTRPGRPSRRGFGPLDDS